MEWIVKVECRVIKQIICSDCTEEQAEESPFDYATDEMEVEQIDWRVLDVEPMPEAA